MRHNFFMRPVVLGMLLLALAAPVAPADDDEARRRPGRSADRKTQVTVPEAPPAEKAAAAPAKNKSAAPKKQAAKPEVSAPLETEERRRPKVEDEE